jgi:predicted glycosyl hydrolase (DUF1957 family)
MDASLELARELKSDIMSIPGIKYWFNTGNEDGTCAVIAIYESKEAAEAAQPKAKQLFGAFAEFMTSEPDPVGYEVVESGVND